MIRGFQRSSGQVEKKKRKEFIFITDIPTDLSEGECAVVEAGRLEKIWKEHGVAKINSNSIVWKASLCFSLLNPYWHLKRNFRVHSGQKWSGPSLISTSYHRGLIYNKFQNAIVSIWTFLSLHVTLWEMSLKNIICLNLCQTVQYQFEACQSVQWKCGEL